MFKKTYLPDVNKIEKKCYVIDAKDKILGRVATTAATILRGKHKTIYTPYMDTGDFVVVLNAEKVRVTGKKMTDKMYQTYTGYPGGRRLISLENLLKKRPTQVITVAVNRMIPKGALGNKIRTRLRVYVGDQHPHQAQKPIVLDVK